MKKKTVIPIFIILTLFYQNFFSQETWTPTSMVNAPTAREWQTAVWSGTKIILWGGNNYNTGGLFNPETNSWIAISLTNAPQGRMSHSAVWTGTKMIIWGGSGGSGNLNTGGIYDPLSDQWTATTTTNAPSSRYFQKSIWTGSNMIIWGGLGNGGVMNTGGKYDPVNDSWVATSTVNAPTARYLHSAVWTGSKLIVWGGSSANGLTLYNTGGIYDPVNDTWTAISTTNAPSARCSQTATWIGNKMIIWGGVTGIISYANTGGIYDPTTDSWTVTSMVNVPDARAYHSANWTGTKLIVWGGITDLQVNTGGIYDPVNNSWATTTVTNAPESREYHSGIWTGTKLVVWGGMHLGNPLNTGGIYSNPSVIGIQNISGNAPKQFALIQNYPNPFNPKTVISFQLPKSNYVFLKIYDVLGNEVTTLVNEHLEAGSYNVDWDASNFASGVYYYRITVHQGGSSTGDFTDVKKMVLIK